MIYNIKVLKKTWIINSLNIHVNMTSYLIFKVWQFVLLWKEYGLAIKRFHH